MHHPTYDLFVIGAGSGGVRAARTAARLGARVAVAEERHLGGTCVNAGCIPKKLLVYAAQYGHAFEDAPAYGWEVAERQQRWADLLHNKNGEIERLNAVYRRLLEESGVDIVEGRARLAGPGRVEAAGGTWHARHVLVATGSRPVRLPIPGVELTITSDEAFHLPSLPDRVVVVGGGYIATEFAGIFRGLGARVTLVHRGELLLRGFDGDVRRVLTEQMASRGIDMRLQRTVERVERAGAGLRATLNDGAVLDADVVLCAVGRVPNTAGLGLEEAGVRLGPDGAVVVDEYSRTSAAGIWAVGDCTNRVNLTPVAIAEGEAVARTIFGDRPVRPRYDRVPTAVFSEPAVGAVGLTEEGARERGFDVQVYRSIFRPLRHALTGRDERWLAKVVVDRATDRVLGIHMVAAEAAEIVQGFAAALEAGITKRQLDATIGIHPTAAEELVLLREPL